MRPYASVLHLDLDAFFASVEQRDKPSLRGKPVVVGGIGGRGVVSTCSYEARAFGIRSAMSTAEARRRAPNAAYLSGRFEAYRASSRAVMALLHEISPTVEQLSIDEAYVDLADADVDIADLAALTRLAAEIRAELTRRTDGLTASVGIGSSKFMAKMASEMAKPDGIRIIEPGTEVTTITPMTARAIPGIGPATMDKLQRLGVRTVADLQKLSVAELNREVGKAWGEGLHALAFARDDRPVISLREAKSISVESTFQTDVRDRELLDGILATQASQVAERIQKSRLFARTVTLKVRLADFTTLSRSRTLRGSTDQQDTILRLGLGLLRGVDLREGVRLLGIGVHNFTEVGQEELFVFGDDDEPVEEARELAGHVATAGAKTSLVASNVRQWRPGADVMHDDFGPGWVQGSGLGRVTVRFETRHSAIGRVRTFKTDDPALRSGTPEMLPWQPPETDTNVSKDVEEPEFP